MEDGGDDEDEEGDVCMNETSVFDTHDDDYECDGDASHNEKGVSDTIFHVNGVSDTKPTFLSRGGGRGRGLGPSCRRSLNRGRGCGHSHSRTSPDSRENSVSDAHEVEVDVGTNGVSDTSQSESVSLLSSFQSESVGLLSGSCSRVNSKSQSVVEAKKEEYGWVVDRKYYPNTPFFRPRVIPKKKMHPSSFSRLVACGRVGQVRRAVYGLPCTTHQTQDFLHPNLSAHVSQQHVSEQAGKHSTKRGAAVDSRTKHPAAGVRRDVTPSRRSKTQSQARSSCGPSSEAVDAAVEVKGLRASAERVASVAE